MMNLAHARAISIYETYREGGTTYKKMGKELKISAQRIGLLVRRGYRLKQLIAKRKKAAEFRSFSREARNAVNLYVAHQELVAASRILFMTLQLLHPRIRKESHERDRSS